MHSRREFLQIGLCALSAGLVPGALAGAAQPVTFEGADKFDAILQKALENRWERLPIGDLVGKVALELQGTPYLANSLELSDDRELCSANFNGLDCVTFYETALAFSRMLKQGGKSRDALIGQLTLMRYRGGKLGDYTSRLHYTADWFADNQKKHVVELLDNLPGATRLPLKVSYMSEHPESSRQLAKHPQLVPIIKKQEAAINALRLTYVPRAKLAAAEALLKTGDIAAICTNEPGLDVTHTGLVLRTADGVAHFMDASSRKINMKVTIEPEPLHEALSRSPKNIGAMFARPLEPRAL